MGGSCGALLTVSSWISSRLGFSWSMPSHQHQQQCPPQAQQQQRTPQAQQQQVKQPCQPPPTKCQEACVPKTKDPCSPRAKKQCPPKCTPQMLPSTQQDLSANRSEDGLAATTCLPPRLLDGVLSSSSSYPHWLQDFPLFLPLSNGAAL